MGDVTQQLERLLPATTVLTPNRRLSAWLKSQYEKTCIKQGKTTWVTPEILPFESWLNWHYQNTHLTKRLINDFQSLLIWQAELSATDFSNSLLQPKQTAKLAQAAYKLLQQWRLNLAHSSFQESLDTAAFQTLAFAYEKELDTRGLIDSAQLFQTLEKTILQKTDSIAFFGFIEFTQSQQQLIDRCLMLGKTVIIEPIKHVNQPEIERFTAKDLSSEIEVMATFCKKQLTENPGQSIACVIPNLNQLRDGIETVFSKIAPNQFNISAGKALSHYPIIDCAFKLLTFNRKRLEIETVSHLLKTPFIEHAQTELSQRMLLDAWFHQQNVHSLSLEYLTKCCAKQTPLLAVTLAQLKTDFTKQPLTQWAKQFNALLQQFGWPGERELNSAEYQTVKRFYELFDQLSSLELQTEAVSFDQAFSVFQQLCQQTLFQPESKTQAIQILGNLEAAGLYFDRLWVAGLNSQDWPALTAANPFIPMRLQREHGLPHATANRSLQFYQALSDQLFHASPNIVLSYAQQLEGITYKPSALIQDFAETEIYSPLEKTLTTQASCETYPAEGLALSQLKIKGGTGAFRSQAACPFQGYASFRLQANNIPETYFGLNAMDRGSITHKALELIWESLQSSKQLDSVESESLNQLIANSIHTALQSYPISNAIKSLEKTRLQSLLLDWLNLEKSREHFTIKSLEQSKETIINGLKLTIRADRIDTLSDGSSMVIDYKTKKVTVTDWQKERLPEPQLPIYALADETIRTIAFAQVRRDKQMLVDSNKLDWAEQKNIWEMELNQLATEIQSGYAAVTPRDKLCCQHCDFQSLCRIHEVTE